jgi:hypothetical protein
LSILALGTLTVSVFTVPGTLVSIGTLTVSVLDEVGAFDGAGSPDSHPTHVLSEGWPEGWARGVEGITTTRVNSKADHARIDTDFFIAQTRTGKR